MVEADASGRRAAKSCFKTRRRGRQKQGPKLREIAVDGAYSSYR
jgi:hypothetical protein